MKFKPYLPPNEGSGLLTVDQDICWRLNPRGLVTPEVIGAICWARNHFRMSDAQEESILNGLGLEYHGKPNGGTVLRPKDIHRMALFSLKGKSEQKGGPSSPPFCLTSPSMPLVHYDAVEVYPCVESDSGIERVEISEHTPDVVAQFWSVALHLEIGHIETIADFPRQSQAEAFGELMRILLLDARASSGMETNRLQTCTASSAASSPANCPQPFL